MESIPEIDVTTAHPGRIYDFYLGGKDNFPADREAGRAILRIAPESRDIARANRAFLQRVVRYLVRDQGIRQIIDVGTGLPTAGNVHEVAQKEAPETRTVCIDNDPIVLVTARALLAGTTAQVAYVQADARQPETILAHPEVRALIDFTQPVALLMVAVLPFVADEDHPARIVTAFRDALAPGSYLGLSHGTSDLHPPEQVKKAEATYQQATVSFVLRTRAQITGFFDGWDLVPPGLVQVPLWRPDGPVPTPAELAKMGLYGGVARLAAHVPPEPVREHGLSG
jgi:hypothetical protein